MSTVGPRLEELLERLFPNPTMRAIALGAIQGAASVVKEKVRARQATCAHPRLRGIVQPLLRTRVLVCVDCGHTEIEEPPK